MPGTKASQTPEVPTWASGLRLPSQLLKSPRTWTSWAAGAQTRKADATRADVGAEGLPQLLVASLVDEVDVQLADRGLAHDSAPIRSIA